MDKIYKKIHAFFLIIFWTIGFNATSQVIITLGTGTVVTGNTTASPINEFYRSLHCQMIYTASELNAACISSGTITKLGFYVSTGVTNVLPNYSIKLKHTTALDVSVYDGTGLTTVFNTPSYNPTAGGFDMLNLNTPFIWNGTDNILVDVCFDQVSAYTSTGTIRTYSSPIPNGFLSIRNDNSPQCGVSCSTISTDKPQIKFEFTNVPTIDLSVSSLLKPLTSKGCLGTDTIIASVKNYGTATTDFSLTPSQLNINISGASANNFSLALSSGTLGACATKDYTITTNYPMFVAGTYNFKGFATISGDGYAKNDTIYSVITKSVTPLPNLGNDTLYCTQPVVTLNSNTTANNFLWSTGSVGTNISITSSGKYWVRATNTNGCINSDTILVNIGTLPIVTLGPDTAFCQGSTIHLYAGSSTSNTYIWSTSSTASSIAVNTTGTYSVLVTDPIGCQSSDAVIVTSKAKPAVSLIFSGQTVFCKDDHTVKVLSDGLPSGGTYVGAAITTNTFSANLAGQGSHIVLYTITGSNGCSNTAKDTLTVNACVGIEELTSNVSFEVYPNPTTGIFTLDLTTSSDIKGALSITSIDGKIVLTDVIEGNGLITKSINISYLANGIYYLKLETKDAIKTYKVVKQ